MYELNLIPYELKAKRKKIKNVIELSSIAVVILIIFAVILVVPRVILMTLENEEKTIIEKIAGDSHILTENANLLKESDSYKVYIDKVDTMKKEQVLVSDKVKGIDKSAPQKVIITEITLAKGLLTIAGDTENYTLIAAFVANLQLTPEYRNSKITSVNAIEPDVTKGAAKPLTYKFIITIG